MPLQGLPPSWTGEGRGIRLVVLGSFPGVASLQAGAYYAHPRNAFWPLMERLLGEPFTGRPIGERPAMLARCGVGLWDVVRQCVRPGSLDADIRQAFVHDDLLDRLRALPDLAGVAHNGKASAQAARHTRTLGCPVWCLPSTSPAHAALDLEQKLLRWAEPFRALGLDAGLAWLRE